jgi:tetratricopeptide (TPR) repeat protein
VIIRDLIRRGDLKRAANIVETELPHCMSRGVSSELWSLFLARADLLRLAGRVDEALESLAAAESENPPSSEDIPSIIGLKKTRGYCVGLLGRFEQSHGLLQAAQRLAAEAVLLEPQCEVWQCDAMIYYFQEDYPKSEHIYRLILGRPTRSEDGIFVPKRSGESGRTL